MPAVCKGGRWVLSRLPVCSASISPISGRLQSKQPFPLDMEVNAALNSQTPRDGRPAATVQVRSSIPNLSSKQKVYELCNQSVDHTGQGWHFGQQTFLHSINSNINIRLHAYLSLIHSSTTSGHPQHFKRVPETKTEIHKGFLQSAVYHQTEIIFEENPINPTCHSVTQRAQRMLEVLNHFRKVHNSVKVNQINH